MIALERWIIIVLAGASFWGIIAGHAVCKRLQDVEDLTFLF